MKNQGRIILDETQIRQGDVLLVRREHTEAEPKQVEPGQRVILAHGEVTGHTHSLKLEAPVSQPPSKPVFDASAERYIQLAFSASLTHEEHSPATPAYLKSGKYELGVQVEAGPHNMLRRVAD